MNLERYEYIISDDQKTYWFYSNGPKGRIKKCVRFKEVSTSRGEMFNLGFGDWDEKKRRINDSARSNNGDTAKILATVAHIVLDFTDKRPNTKILVSATPGRIRLYRINITREFLPIYTLFELSGVTEHNIIEPFTKNKEYVGFVVKRRFFKRNSQLKS